MTFPKSPALWPPISPEDFADDFEMTEELGDLGGEVDMEDLEGPPIPEDDEDWEYYLDDDDVDEEDGEN
jgi:hypothetical protein